MIETLSIKRLTTAALDVTLGLKRMSGPLWDILTFSPADERISPKKTVCIAIEKSGFSVAYGSRFLSKISMKAYRRYLQEEGKYPQPEALASSAALAMNELGAAKPEISLSIPKAWTIVTTAEFPSTVKESLADVVSYELDRLTPLAADEAYYDYRIVAEEKDRISLLITATRSDVIDRYIEALKDSGVAVNSVMVSLSGIGTLCRYINQQPDAVYLETSNKGYEGALFLDGAISRSFTGIFAASDDKSRVDAITKELEPLKETLSNRQGPVQAVLSLDGASPAFREMLKINMGMPFKVLGETDLRLKVSGDPKEVPYVAIGGVLESLWPKTKGLNLLSKGRHEIPKTPKALTALLLAGILTALSLYIVSPVWVEGKRLKVIERNIALRKDDVRKVEALKKETGALAAEISMIEGFKTAKPMVLNMLKELTELLPRSAWLTRARIGESTVEIEGYAASATALLPKLESSKYFQKVEFASPTFRDIRMDADRFVIKMEIKGIKKPEVEKPKGERAKSEKK